MIVLAECEIVSHAAAISVMGWLVHLNSLSNVRIVNAIAAKVNANGRDGGWRVPHLRL